jgi:hypothetical protein
LARRKQLSTQHLQEYSFGSADVIIVALLALLVVIVSWRRSAYLRAARANLRQRPLNDDGIVIGAEGFVLERANAPAVLLLHGAGDTPQTLRYLGMLCMRVDFTSQRRCFRDTAEPCRILRESALTI